MYDYATVTQQVRILNEIQTLNSNLVTYSETITYLLILLIICLLSFFAYKFILRCLGK